MHTYCVIRRHACFPYKGSFDLNAELNVIEMFPVLNKFTLYVNRDVIVGDSELRSVVQRFQHLGQLLLKRT